MRGSYAPGGGQLDVLAPVNPLLIASAAAAGANAAYLLRFRVEKPFTVSVVHAFCSALSTGGNLDLGLGTLSGSTWTPLATMGSTAAVAGDNAFTLSTPQIVVPFTDYALAFACSNAVPTWARLAGLSATIAAIGNLCLTKATSFPLPNPISSAAGSTYIPLLWAT